jgi:hypothetical protein
MSKFLVKFECLSKGDLVAASLIPTSGAGPRAAALEELFGSSSGGKKGSSSSKKGAADSDAAAAAAAAEEEAAARGLGLDGDLGTGLGAYEAAYGEGSGARVQALPKTSHIQEAMRVAVSEFFSRMPASKCQNCGCTNPSIRKQGSSKLFKQFSRKALLANSMRGIDVASLVGAGSRVAAQQVQEMIQRQQQEADEAAAAGSKKKRKRGVAEEQQDEDDEQVGSCGVAYTVLVLCYDVRSLTLTLTCLPISHEPVLTVCLVRVVFHIVRACCGCCSLVYVCCARSRQHRC